MKKYRVTPSCIAAENENKTIILQINAKEYFGLDAVGTFIWQILEQSPASISELKLRVMEEFDVDSATCERDINALAEKLTEANLIEEVAE